MKTLILFSAIAICSFASCDDSSHFPHGEGPGRPHSKKHSADVAIEWINLQQKLVKTTPGFTPLVASRSFAYSGLALYESVIKGSPYGQPVVSSDISSALHPSAPKQIMYSPASANAAMAYMLKNLFGNTSAANRATIDSLEMAFNSKYKSEVAAGIVDHSAEYGRQVAGAVFEWSKTDGGHEAYLHVTSDTYVPPTGPGLWIPTPTAFSKPIHPYWGSNRSFVANSAVSTMPPAPTAYSENVDSDFYKMNSELYNLSLSLTEDQIKIAKHWADLPGNYGTPAHYTHIVTQLVKQNKFNLDKAAMTYALHGLAINEALIAVFKAKYTYNLIRPISYIRNVLGHGEWNTVVGTPAHPEYPSAHAVIGGASYTVLEKVFGKNCSFVDRTHENLYGARTYQNLRAYAEEAAWSRVLAGIHYEFSAKVGMAQGEKIGQMVQKKFFGKFQPHDFQ